METFAVSHQLSRLGPQLNKRRHVFINNIGLVPYGCFQQDGISPHPALRFARALDPMMTTPNRLPPEPDAPPCDCQRGLATPMLWPTYVRLALCLLAPSSAPKTLEFRWGDVFRLKEVQPHPPSIVSTRNTSPGQPRSWSSAWHSFGTRSRCQSEPPSRA
jgi:hypothetical protein